MPRTPRIRNVPCPFPGCSFKSTSKGGITNHQRAKHRRDPWFNRRERAALHLGGIQLQDEPLPAPDHNDEIIDWQAFNGLAINEENPGDDGDPNPQPDELDADPPPDAPAGDPLPAYKVKYHPKMNGLPCDSDGNFLPPGTLPSPWPTRAADDYTPFCDFASFCLAEHLYSKMQSSAKNINRLFEILMAYFSQNELDAQSPYASAEDMYATIDSIPFGDVPWESFTLRFSGNVPEDDPIPWHSQEYEVWFRNPRSLLHWILQNQAFDQHIDYAPKVIVDHQGNRLYSDFMSGRWAWEQATNITNANPALCGCTFCPIFLGSDKTTVSVATGQNDFYPLYMSLGLLQTGSRLAHKNGVVLVGFLAIPKTDKEHEGTKEFRDFRREIFHRSLSTILEPLRKGMTVPEVVHYPDGHYRRTIYGIGPYIADYPEQVLLACVVSGWCPKCDADHTDLDNTENASELISRRTHEATQRAMDALTDKEVWDGYGIIPGIMPFTADFPHADIHELLAPDLLHQIIKGTFKDHLVTWVTEWIELHYAKSNAEAILADIDQRIASAPPFSRLRRFKEGRSFKQWTGNDSKALMKVYLPALIPHVPPEIVQAIHVFLEICYTARKAVISELDIRQMEDNIARFHHLRPLAFDDVRPKGYSLPRQHSLVHYPDLIRDFGAPVGLCSSITESKHIDAVKKPYRRSNRYEALGQMLLTNQRMDKLAAARVEFSKHGMLDKPVAGEVVAAPTLERGNGGDTTSGDDEEVIGEVFLAKRTVRNSPNTIESAARYIGVCHFPLLVSRFLYLQLHSDDPDADPDAIPISELPVIPPNARFRVFPSATAKFYSPSDVVGETLHSEHIRACKSWGKHKHPRYDTVFISRNNGEKGFRGLFVGRVHLFFTFTFAGRLFPCALISEYSTYGDEPCPLTGMWRVTPDKDRRRGGPLYSVIHVRAILRAAHLLGCASQRDHYLPTRFRYHQTLDSFKSFYVNKFVDHHAYEIAF